METKRGLSSGGTGSAGGPGSPTTPLRRRDRLPHRTADKTAPPEREEDETLAALQAGLEAATAAAKSAGKRRLDPMARRPLLLRQATLADRRAYSTEPEHLRDAATVTRVEYVLNHGEALRPWQPAEGRRAPRTRQVETWSDMVRFELE